MLSNIVKLFCVFAMALFLSACGFTPLYEPSSIAPDGTKQLPPQFQQVSFSAPTDRETQLIYRELGFRLNSDSADKVYRLEVNLKKNSRRITTTTSSNPRETNIAILEAHFVLRRASDEAIIVDERRFAQATYNTTGQGVADEQALVNANERAARTLAELIRAKLVAVLSQDEIEPIEPEGENITIIRQ